MSLKIMSRVWEHSRAKHAELLIMLALADWSSDAGESFPSIPKLAHKARLTERQTRRALNSLEELGELRRTRSNGGRNRSNRYVITVTENPDKITLTKLQGKNYPEKNDQETLVKMSGAYIRHRYVNKTALNSADSASPISKKRKRTRPAPDPAQREAFSQFYEAYPRHVGKAEAEKVWLKLNPDRTLTARIMTAVQAYSEEVRDTEPKYIKHPAPWLNARRWEDEPEVSNSNGHAQPKIKDLGNGMFEVDGRQMDRQTYERRYGQATA